MKPRLMPVILLLISALGLQSDLRADPTPTPADSGVTKPLVDFSSKAPAFSPDTESDSQVVIAPSNDGKGVDITLDPGPADYPGVSIKPQGVPMWDLSAFGDVQATVTNTGASMLAINLRVDNEGDYHDNPWNTEHFTLNPGETKTLKVVFGYQFGGQPGFALNPGAIVQLLLFTSKVTDAPVTFRVLSVVAGGVPGERPATDASNAVILVPTHNLMARSSITTGFNGMNVATALEK